MPRSLVSIFRMARGLFVGLVRGFGFLVVFLLNFERGRGLFFDFGRLFGLLVFFRFLVVFRRLRGFRPIGVAGRRFNFLDRRFDLLLAFGHARLLLALLSDCALVRFSLFCRRAVERLARLDHVGVARQCHLVVGNRPITLVALLARAPALVIGLRILRLDWDQPVEIVGRLGVAFRLYQDHGARAQGAGIVGLAFEDGVVVGDGAD